MNSPMSKEHKKCVETAIDHITKNLHREVSLKELAEVVHYSPFHFQKLFREEIRETPKQYIMKLRLENALHFMIIHPHKSVLEISIDCGFSSPSAFSRAVRNFYGSPPDEIRRLSPRERAQLIHRKTGERELHEPVAEDRLTALDVTIKRVSPITGIYAMAPFDDTRKIQEAFREITRLAEANDLTFSPRDVMGILTPHQGNIYKAFVATGNREVPSKFNALTTKGGKYAVFSIRGDRTETIRAAQFFFKEWLPQSGYRLADVSGFELFSEHPALVPYSELMREVHVPIEAV